MVGILMKYINRFLRSFIAICLISLIISLNGCLPMITNVKHNSGLTSSSNSQITSSQASSSNVSSSASSNQASSSSRIISNQSSSKPNTTSSTPTQSTYSNPNTLMKSFTSISPKDYYGYKQLNATEKIAYDQIAQALEKCESKVNFEPSINDKATFDRIFNYYIADHPETIQLGKEQFTIKSDSSGILSVDFSTAYRFNKAEKDRRLAAMNAKLPEILGNIPVSATDFEVELQIHDWLVKNCRYDTSAPNCYDAYGAIVDGRAVCQGYAYAMQYLLYRAGIQCLFVSGSSQNQPHGWNIVLINGNYYQLDITWDDPLSQTPVLSHQYFNLTDTEIGFDHTTDSTNYPLPDCNSNTDNYFIKKGLILNSIGDADTVLKNAMQQAASQKSTDQIDVRINPAQYSAIYDQLVQYHGRKLSLYKNEINNSGIKNKITGVSYGPVEKGSPGQPYYIFSVYLSY